MQHDYIVFLTMRQRISCLLFVWCMISNVSLRGDVDAILVSGNAQSVPAVRIITGDTTLSLKDTEHALLFLPSQEMLPERWTHVQNEDSLAELQNEQFRAVGSSRGYGGAIADAISTQTVQLEQIQAFVANRSLPRSDVATIFSPADGSTLLNPRPTFRRLPVTDEKTKTNLYPAVSARIFRAGQQIAEISFAENRDSVAWNEMSKKPNELVQGDYTIQIDGSNQTVRFTVQSDEIQKWMEQRFVRVESLLGKDDPVAVQIAAETLTQDLENGPFYSDALERIAAIPKEKSTPYLEGLYSYLTLRLSGREGVARGGANDEQEQAERKEVQEKPSAYAAFIHKLLLNEKWNDASAHLDELEKKLSTLPDTSENRELKALYHLYRGMVFAESGMTKWQDGYTEFTQALEQLDSVAAVGVKEERDVADSRFRAANNFGNYLLRLTQDRLNNHALAIATGDGAVLTTALFAWVQALETYQKALDIAEKTLTDQPELAATSKVNLARLYALLGDIIRTVDQDQATTEIEKGAFATAEKLVKEVLEMKLPNEDRLEGAAHHILADIAFRWGEKDVCQAESEMARACYVRTGTLSGVEAIERLLGMLDTTDRTAALKHLSISNALSEVLREQIPADTIGLSRAGFFARRAYVNERMIGLLIQEGKPVEALTVLEAAKGWSLKDVLASAGINADSDEMTEIRSVQDILVDFPKEIAAVEYFIGSESCWGFLIVNGNVEAFPLLDNGKPIASRELIATVQQYLSESELQARKMSARIIGGEGFGKEWESTLYRLRMCLLPDAVLDKLRKSQTKNVLIVPHHILHYLPFAALVVEQDKNDDPKAMPKPTFVLDEPFGVFQSPSLVIWDTLHQRENRPIQPVTVVGISNFTRAPNLNGVKKDIENTLNAFGRERVQAVVENAATKDAVKTILRQRGLLLIGTHGMNNPVQPLHGLLLLRSGDGNDDAITAEEIFGTTVGKDLVVLSACYSGLADQSPLPGDDLFGIQRALLHGGARGVIAGMWDVYDSTGPMIVDALLKRLAAGESASAALAGAQRNFLKQQREEGANNPWTHPYFWAVYTLTGDGRACCATE
ncbi:MAG: CHAT domain-containing protein [Planctomycetaceae bacterium]|jgi:hypothetical protein|nr:CHAT domain-containing protein [Planctomycetaceae bacterium]